MAAKPFYKEIFATETIVAYINGEIAYRYLLQSPLIR